MGMCAPLNGRDDFSSHAQIDGICQKVAAVLHFSLEFLAFGIKRPTNGHIFRSSTVNLYYYRLPGLRQQCSRLQILEMVENKCL